MGRLNVQLWLIGGEVFKNNPKTSVEDVNPMPTEVFPFIRTDPEDLNVVWLNTTAKTTTARWGNNLEITPGGDRIPHQSPPWTPIDANGTIWGYSYEIKLIRATGVESVTGEFEVKISRLASQTHYGNTTKLFIGWFKREDSNGEEWKAGVELTIEIALWSWTLRVTAKAGTWHGSDGGEIYKHEGNVSEFDGEDATFTIHGKLTLWKEDGIIKAWVECEGVPAFTYDTDPGDIEVVAMGEDWNVNFADAYFMWSARAGRGNNEN